MSTLSTTNIKHPSSGSNNIVLASDGSATITTLSGTTITGTSVRGVITSGTAVASTSGTSIDFTSIPSWVKRITVMFNGVSFNSTAQPRIRVGRSSGTVFVTSGYVGAVGFSGGDTGYSGGFDLASSGFTSASNAYTGKSILTLLNSNTWMFSCNMSASAVCIVGAGSVDAGGVLDTIRVTSTSGTDTFDAGSINILYEG